MDFLDDIHRKAAEQKELDKSVAAKRALSKRGQSAESVLEDREYIRHEIQAHQHVRDLETMALMLFSGQEIEQDRVTEVPVLVPLDKDRVSQLTACATIKLALLRKVVPDIKSVELTGAGGEELGSQRELATIELRNRLRAALTTGQPLIPEPVALLEDGYGCLG